jgi:hypothetical protein
VDATSSSTSCIRCGRGCSPFASRTTSDPSAVDATADATSRRRYVRVVRRASPRMHLGCISGASEISEPGVEDGGQDKGVDPRTVHRCDLIRNSWDPRGPAKDPHRAQPVERPKKNGIKGVPGATIPAFFVCRCQNPARHFRVNF